MLILLATDNLMTRGHLTPALEAAGARVVTRPGDEEPDLVAVDLTAARSVERVREARSSWPAARILAFGPHVDGDAFAAARKAGADEAVARGRVLDRMLLLAREAAP
jgi:DNA-binding NarL/FixJ family response regulator